MPRIAPLSLLFVIGCAHGPMAQKRLENAPRLAVVMVFDQLRADYLSRFGDQLLPARTADGKLGGFKALMAAGATFPVAEHRVLMAMTCPGHATIATGAWPYRHGITRNRWYDSMGRHYCVGDREAPVIGGSQVDRFEGRSPRKMHGPTMGDTLKNADPRSRVVSVAIKDRAAVLLGGFRADAAIWLDPSSDWTTSAFYQRDGKRPDWLNALNRAQRDQASQPAPFHFESTSGRASGAQSVKLEPNRGSMDAIYTPHGDVRTAEAAEAAMAAHKLGQDEASDLLLVSFSSLDKAGHHHGPNSAHMEGMFLSADRAIARMLNHLEATVPGGLANVVVAVTGDHGVGPQAAYAHSTRLKARQLDQDELQSRLNARLDMLFGATKTGERWILAIEDLNLYMNRRLAAQRGLRIDRLLAAAKELLTEEPGVLMGITSAEVQAGKRLPGLWGEQLENSFVAGRSGDVIGIPAPFTLPDGTPANHYTGYSYDRQVPLLMMGPGIRQGRHPGAVEIIDLAPTIATLLGTIHPAMAEGRVLVEALAP